MFNPLTSYFSLLPYLFRHDWLIYSNVIRVSTPWMIWKDSPFSVLKPTDTFDSTIPITELPHHFQTWWHLLCSSITNPSPSSHRPVQPSKLTRLPLTFEQHRGEMSKKLRIEVGGDIILIDKGSGVTTVPGIEYIRPLRSHKCCPVLSIIYELYKNNWTLNTSISRHLYFMTIFCLEKQPEKKKKKFKFT